MVKRKVTRIIKFLEGILRDRGLNISKIILFGSQVNGGATEESDIDLVIVSNDFSNKDIFKRVALIKEAEINTIKKFMVPLDIITMTPEEYNNETSLIASYAKEGEIVYAK